MTVVIATGRMTPGAVLHEHAIGLDCYVVTYNGARALTRGGRAGDQHHNPTRVLLPDRTEVPFDRPIPAAALAEDDACRAASAAFLAKTGVPPAVSIGGDVIFHTPLPLPVSIGLVEWALERGLPFNLYIDDVLYCDRRFKDTVSIQMYGCLGQVPHVVLDDALHFLRNHPSPSTKVILFTEDLKHSATVALEASMRKLVRQIAEAGAGGVPLPDAEVPTVVPAQFFVEALAPGINKGQGLRKLMAVLGAPDGPLPGTTVDNVVAFGDGENDLEFLQYAGLSVAMANAHETTAKGATYQSAFTNREAAVARELLALWRAGQFVVDASLAPAEGSEEELALLSE
ncbi:hypothetical protein H696_04023 [Fonticula alba]|uniref:Uncharacterized protein n=1 Tax=Fonticula alba TaxID=691883 RepID=A0A058Z5P6_FONAL|nr:hypothetical protein H696_04023 [Fonticula alba]KCV69604.1 hypothetical protein H696_04023 [Fonticula alba]|eukprot:XP_009496169.1 hypothetical protein H696_04023 [Fonticula alba]